MIVGLGIDLTPLDRVDRLAKRHPQFVNRILTPCEQDQYRQFSGQRAVEYLAGRWSLKESFGKAMGTGIGKTVGFQDVEIVDNQSGAPVVTRSPFAGRVHASVSHTATLVMTEIILESEHEK
jgi:holo-[acyl-carrier protein] synthase